MVGFLTRLKPRIRNVRQRYLHRGKRYGAAALISLFAILLAGLNLPLPLARVWPYVLLCVVLLSAWYSGLGSGLLSAFVVMAGAETIHAPLWGEQNDLILLLLLVIIVVVLSSARVQRRQLAAPAEALLTRPRPELNATVAETAHTQILESFRDTPIAALDSGWHFTYVSGAGVRLLRLPASEIMGRTLFDVFPHKDGAKLSSHLHAVLKGGSPAHFEEYLEARQAWFGFHACSSLGGLVFTFNDVSEAKKQEALRPLPIWDEDREFKRIFARIDYTLVDRARCYILHQFAKQVVKLPGDLAEVGVYKGGTAKLLSLTVSPRVKKTLHLFDTFSGMPPTEAQVDHHHEGDLGDTSLEAVQRQLRDCDNVRFYKGFFPHTAGPIENSRFCMIHIDVDIYKSVKDSCEFFYPRLEKGGVMIFDDYGFSSCPGARKAVDEFFTDKAEIPVYLPSGQCVVIRE